MKRYLPILISLIVVAILFSIMFYHKSHTIIVDKFGDFRKERSCVRLPKFLEKQHIPKPIIIDLTQKHFTGIAFLYGKSLDHPLHRKSWERYEHFGTYVLDDSGNLYLSPMPFISIRPTTFNLQKNIYKMDSDTGKLSIFMHFDNVRPSESNPYGIISLAYDCDDHTLWTSSIDETDYDREKGTIYHIDPKSMEIVQEIKGFDALTLRFIHTGKGKYLLAGSAKDSGLYAFRFDKKILSPEPEKLLELPQSNEHIRKIKVLDRNRLELQTIPFSYTLVAESGYAYRNIYLAEKIEGSAEWKVTKINGGH